MRNYADVWSLAKEIFVRSSAVTTGDLASNSENRDYRVLAERSIRAAKIFLTEFSKQSDQED